jgi:hypothetical protein
MSFPFVQPYFGLGNSLQTAQAVGGAVGGWVELGRHTLTGGTSTLEVTGLADKRYLMLLSHRIGSMEAIQRFNGDSGSNYSYRRTNDGSDHNTGTSKTQLVNLVGWNTTEFNVSYVANLASKEKLVLGHTIADRGAGSGTANSRNEFSGKWANTSDAVNAVSMSTISGSFDADSELVVLGWDPADTHTTNFWEELASVTLGSDGDVLSSGTISAKKYLWVQAFIKNAGDTARFNTQVTFNNDTSSNYAMRRSMDGGTDSTSTGDSNLFSSGVTGSNDDLWCMNLFIVNNGSNEKLCIAHGFDTYIGSGAGNAPSQRYEAVGKWANTSNQITEIDITNSDTSNYDAISELRVWGSD